MAVRRFLILIGGLVALASASIAHAQDRSAPPASRFAGWTSAVIAADWTDSMGEPIDAFDNARRDLAAGFRKAGFDPALMVEHSLRPDVASPITPALALAEIERIANRDGLRGCFIYLTSHGGPGGIVFGPDGRMSPAQLDAALDQWCQARPTVVVVSACFSGVFIPALSAPNRMVLTAARRDRSSFGCGAGATYPYFDGCILSSLDEARDFLDLAALARTCVSDRETAERLRPASEPQLFVGGEMQLLLPTLRFNR
jgi:hypothetical protein